MLASSSIDAVGGTFMSVTATLAVQAQNQLTIGLDAQGIIPIVSPHITRHIGTTFDVCARGERPSAAGTRLAETRNA